MSDDLREYNRIRNERLNNMRKGDMFNPWLAMKQAWHSPTPQLFSGYTTDERLDQKLWDEAYKRAEEVGALTNARKAQMENASPEQAAQLKQMVENPPEELPIQWVKRTDPETYRRRAAPDYNHIEKVQGLIDQGYSAEQINKMTRPSSWTGVK